VKNQFRRELPVLLGREIFLRREELEKQRVFGANGNILVLLSYLFGGKTSKPRTSYTSITALYPIHRT
jgi:uroporphyrinogen-III decarboxylase